MNIYIRTLPGVFPWVIKCTEAEANSIIHRLMSDDAIYRPGPYGSNAGSSYAYTVNFENDFGGDLWLSEASANRIVLWSHPDTIVQDHISKMRLRIMRSREAYVTE